MRFSPVGDTGGPKGKAAAELEAKVGEARARLQAVTTGQRTAAERLATARASHEQARVDEGAGTGDAKKVAKAAKDRADAEAAYAATDWDAETRVARATVATLEGRHALLVESDAEALLEELREEHEAIPERIRSHIRALSDEITQWHAASRRVASILIPVPNRDGRDVPYLGLDSLSAELKSLLMRLDAIPAPMPTNRRPLAGPRVEEVARAA